MVLCVISDNFLAMASPRKLSAPSDYAELLYRYDTWLFDCDGVIWSGDHAIEGASKAIDFLRDNGKRVIFVTNNAARSRKMLKKKFDRLRIAASEVRTKFLWMGHQLTSPNY